MIICSIFLRVLNIFIATLRNASYVQDFALIHDRVHPADYPTYENKNNNDIRIRDVILNDRTFFSHTARVRVTH